MPGATQRQKGVKRKLNAMDEKFAGKNVLLIDDSIVRGTTSREIVSMARDAGAKKVYFASCAPPITHAHIYGIDLASPNELIAHDHGHDRALTEIAKHVGADQVIFQDLEDLKAACADAEVRRPAASAETQKPRDFEVGVFCGEYVTPVGEGYLRHLEEVRGGARKMKVMEKVRGVVANGVVAAEEEEMANGGMDGDVGAAAGDNGDGGEKRGRFEREQQGGEETPKDRMDISLHNFGDFKR